MFLGLEYNTCNKVSGEFCNRLDVFSSPTHRPDVSAANSGQINQATPTATTPMSPSAGGHSSNNTASHVETPTPRMFGDTLHLHRSSNSAKQVDRCFSSLYTILF